jgi:hypothetical protein
MVAILSTAQQVWDRRCSARIEGNGGAFGAGHMDIEALRCAAEAARATSNNGATCEILPDWEPTPENIQALPEPLRRYIMYLKTRCDPAGDIQEIWSLREQVAGLAARLLERG